MPTPSGSPPARRAIGRGHAWCFAPTETADFERAVRRSPGFQAVSAATPVEVTLRTDIL